MAATVVVRGWQIDPGHKDYGLYELTLDDGTIYGRVLSVLNTHTFEGITYQTSTEYWALREDPAPLKEQPRYTLKGRNGLWSEFTSQTFPGAGLLPVFATPEQIEFRGGQDAPADIFCTNDSERNVCLDINVSYQQSTRQWSGTLRWFHTGDPVPDGLLVRLEHGDGETITSFVATAQPEGDRWSFGQGEIRL